MNPAIPTKKMLWADLTRLFWPVALELMLASLISMVTMALVSSLGKEAVSAVGITGQPLMIPFVAIQAFSVGGMALVARSIGMGDKEQARIACEQSMLLGSLFGILFGIIMYVWGGTFILWMGATPDYYGMAELFMRYSAIGSVFSSITTMVSAMLRSAGRVRITMYYNVLSNVVNVLICILLINGIGPFPALGILGAAIAQLVARVIGCAYALYLLLTLRDLPVRPAIKGMFIPNAATIKRIGRIGSPSALEQLALRVGLISFTIYIINLGTAEYAAHNIAGNIHGYVVNFGSAIGVALVSLVGQNLGAKRADIAQMYFKTAIYMCFLVSAVLIVPLLAAPQYIALVFTREPDVIDNIVTALRILAFFTTSQIFSMAIAGGLRGGGDTTWPLIATVSGVLGMRMVMGYFFVVAFGWGIAGAWFCWLLDQTMRAVIIYFRYRSGKWKLVKV